MQARFIQNGDSIDYTPSTDVTAGDVIVQGSLVGVAKRDISANTLGSLTVQGVFDFPKDSGASTAISVGSPVYWDEVNARATTEDNSGSSGSGGDYPLIGKTIAAATDADAAVRVRMSQ